MKYFAVRSSLFLLLVTFAVSEWAHLRENCAAVNLRGPRRRPRKQQNSGKKRHLLIKRFRMGAHISKEQRAQ